MKSEFLLTASVVAVTLCAVLVAAESGSCYVNSGSCSGVPITFVIGGGTSTTTTTTTTISNPANISFTLYATDGTTHYQQIYVTMHDGVTHGALNSNPVTVSQPTTLISPTSLADFEFTYDSGNLDVLVNGLNINNLNGTTAQNALSVVVAKPASLQVSGTTPFKAYRVELPSNFSYNSITLTIGLSDVSGVNYNNISVVSCSSYNSISSACNDSNGWVAQSITADSAHQLVTLNINHFSYYAVVPGTSSQTQTTTTTTTTSSSTSTTTTSTTVQNSASSSGSSSGGGGGGGGGTIFIPTTTTTTQIPTTTTSVLIVRRNESSNSSSSSSQTSETAPISGFLGLSNQLSPLLIAGIIVVASVAAIPWIKNNYSMPRLKFWEKSYKTFPSYRKSKKSKNKHTELKLSM